MVPLTYEQVSIYFRGPELARRNTREKTSFYRSILHYVHYLIIVRITSSSSCVVTGKTQVHDEYQLNRHENTSRPCYINVLLKVHDVLPHAGAYGYYAKRNIA